MLSMLFLRFCRGAPAVVDFRRSLPPIPSLTALILFDRCRITAQQASPLNGAILARMPQLTAERFLQNLLAPIPMIDAVALEQFAAEAAPMGDDGMDDDELDHELDDEWDNEEEEAEGQPFFGPAWEH